MVAQRRVALFGGSFNPPHMGHQLLGLYVLETREVDELWFVPCFEHPFQKPLAPFEHRWAMCERLAAGLGPRAKVCDIERRLGGPSLTLRTVKALRSECADIEFHVVIGSDLAVETAGWFGAEELRRTVSFLVVARSVEGGGATAGGGVAMPAISSTEVRRRLASGGAVHDLVPRSVLAYIDETGLYRARDDDAAGFSEGYRSSKP